MASLRYQAPQTFPENTRSSSAGIQGAQRGGAVLAGGVHDAGQRWQFGRDGGHQVGDIVRIGDIGRRRPEPRSRTARRSSSIALLRGARRVRDGWSAPDGGRRARPGSPAISSPSGAKTAGDQICGIGTQFERGRGSAARCACSAGAHGPACRAARSGLPRDAAPTMWLISRDHSAVSSRTRPSRRTQSASPPQTWGSSRATARQKPHRLVCSGDTGSVSMHPLCVAGDHPDRGAQIGAAAARNSRWLPSEDAVLHPQQRPHRRRGVLLAAPRHAGCAASVRLPPRRAGRRPDVPRRCRMPAAASVRCRWPLRGQRVEHRRHRRRRRRR